MRDTLVTVTTSGFEVYAVGSTSIALQCRFICRNGGVLRIPQLSRVTISNEGAYSVSLQVIESSRFFTFECCWNYYDENTLEVTVEDGLTPQISADTVVYGRFTHT